LAVPVCVIITTRDQLVPVAAQYELVGRLPDAEVVELVGARHEAVYNRAHEIVKEIAAFATADEAAT
jgi:homoserine acetyltransferase